MSSLHSVIKCFSLTIFFDSSDKFKSPMVYRFLDFEFLRASESFCMIWRLSWCFVSTTSSVFGPLFSCCQAMRLLPQCFLCICPLYGLFYSFLILPQCNFYHWSDISTSVLLNPFGCTYMFVCPFYILCNTKNLFWTLYKNYSLLFFSITFVNFIFRSNELRYKNPFISVLLWDHIGNTTSTYQSYTCDDTWRNQCDEIYHVIYKMIENIKNLLCFLFLVII